MKARLVREGYPKHVREEKENGIHSLIWRWIHSETLADLDSNREILASELRTKEQDYLWSYWHHLEPHFIRAYTKHFPNFGAESTQRSEASHLLIKSHTNRHTPIDTAVSKLRDLVVEMARNHIDVINKQRGNVPRLVNNKPAFREIKRSITHEALNLLLCEWIATMMLAEDLEQLNQPCPNIEGNRCRIECLLPVQFDLPCRCFLYHCLIEQKLISMSLIHPRWALDGPDYVPKNGWKMVLYISDVGQLSPTAHNQESKEGDRFEDHGMALLETTTLQSIDYGKFLLSHDRELYAKALAELNNAFQNCRGRYEAIPTTFVDPIHPKEVRFTKGKRRRGLTNHEAAQAQEADERRHRRAKSIELARTQKHATMKEKDRALEKSLFDRNTRLL